MRLLRDNSLSIFFLAMFLGASPARRSSGTEHFNDQQVPTKRPDVAGALRDVVGVPVTSSRTGSRSTCRPRSSSSRRCCCCSAGRRSPSRSDRRGSSPTNTSRSDRTPGRDSPRWARTSGWRTAYTGTRCSGHERRSGSGSGSRSSSPAPSSTTPTNSTTKRDGDLVRLRGQQRLLVADAAELAVGVPRRRLNGHLLGLAATAWIAGVQARRRTPRRHRDRRLTLPTVSSAG